ncbi:MAG: MATE family efflux transporter [Nitrospinota bacterium]|nr:MAG: MATE family efflux transporter [Nitrospinota bacterium]
MKEALATEKYLLTEGSLLRSVLRLALPMLLGNFLLNTLNIVDMIFVGKLGPAAIAAVSIGGTLEGLIWTVLVGMGMATTAMVSRYVGAREPHVATQAAVQSLFLAVLFSLVIALIGATAAAHLLRLLGAASEVVEVGTGYVAITFIGSFTLILYFVIQSIFRGAGDAVTPMIIMAIIAGLNILLDPLLIFGLWIFPRLGVTGAALATTTARGVGLIVSFYYLFRPQSPLPFARSDLRIRLDLIRRLVTIGFPSSINAALLSLASIILMRIVSAYGTIALAAYGVGLRLDLIAMMPGWALGNSAATLVGQNLGAEKKERAAQSAWLVTGLHVGIMFVLATTFYLFAEPIIAVFNTHPEVIRVGQEYVRIVVLSYPFLALSMVLSRAFGGAGDTISPLVVTSLSLFGLLFPLSLLLPRLWSLGTRGVWMAIAVATVFQGSAMALWFLQGRWKERKV